MIDANSRAPHGAAPLRAWSTIVATYSDRCLTYRAKLAEITSGFEGIGAEGTAIFRRAFSLSLSPSLLYHCLSPSKSSSARNNDVFAALAAVRGTNDAIARIGATVRINARRFSRVRLPAHSRISHRDPMSPFIGGTLTRWRWRKPYCDHCPCHWERQTDGGTGGGERARPLAERTCRRDRHLWTDMLS